MEKTMSNEIIDDYFEALARLKGNSPIRIPKDSKIGMTPKK